MTWEYLQITIVDSIPRFIWHVSSTYFTLHTKFNKHEFSIKYKFLCLTVTHFKNTPQIKNIFSHSRSAWRLITICLTVFSISEKRSGRGGPTNNRQIPTSDKNIYQLRHKSRMKSRPAPPHLTQPPAHPFRPLSPAIALLGSPHALSSSSDF